MSKTVYQTDSDGLFLYAAVANELPLAPSFFNVPYGAVEEQPPAAPAGRVARWAGQAWELEEDHRHDSLWLVGAGEKYTVGAAVKVDDQDMRYPGWGAVPDWLTNIEPAPAVTTG